MNQIKEHPRLIIASLEMGARIDVTAHIPSAFRHGTSAIVRERFNDL